METEYQRKLINKITELFTKYIGIKKYSEQSGVIDRAVNLLDGGQFNKLIKEISKWNDPCLKCILEKYEENYGSKKLHFYLYLVGLLKILIYNAVISKEFGRELQKWVMVRGIELEEWLSQNKYLKYKAKYLALKKKLVK